MQDFNAILAAAHTQPNNASFRGKAITLPQTEREFRYYICERTRLLKRATYTGEPIRNGYRKRRFQYCMQAGETIISEWEVRKLARQADYKEREFKKLVEAKLNRKVCMYELQEMVCNAGKHRNTATTGCYRTEIPKSAKVYAK